MGLKIQTIKDIRIYLTTELAGSYAEEEIRSLSSIIISSVLGITGMQHLFLTERSVNHKQASEIISICSELKSGKPIQYILGETVFYDCIIQLNSATLIPRPETEELVDLIIHQNRGYTGSIIDFGTGSGCIAIALALNLPGASVTGTDISDEALMTAVSNAKLNNAEVKFVKDDILDPDTDTLEKAGILVSNPPYVRISEKRLMHKNVLAFEPHSALFVEDSDPLLYYDAVLKKAARLICPPGKIYFEINEALGKSMVSLAQSFGFSALEVIKDINGKDRIMKGIRHAG